MTPIPDIVALAATPENDGVVHLSADSGSGVFVVAAVNVGAEGIITVTADTAAANLPLAVSICETDPVTSNCINPGIAGCGGNYHGRRGVDAHLRRVCHRHRGHRGRPRKQPDLRSFPRRRRNHSRRGPA